jgi:hypothetical protein
MMRKKKLEFGVSSALLVGALGAATVGCLLGPEIAVNPAPNECFDEDGTLIGYTDTSDCESVLSECRSGRSTAYRCVNVPTGPCVDDPNAPGCSSNDLCADDPNAPGCINGRDVCGTPPPGGFEPGCGRPPEIDEDMMSDLDLDELDMPEDQDPEADMDEEPDSDVDQPHDDEDMSEEEDG